MNPFPFIAGQPDGDFPINLFYQKEYWNGRDALIGTPGLTQKIDFGYGEVRGMLRDNYNGTEYLYVVMKNKVFRINTDWTYTQITGALDTTEGIVTMAAGGGYVVIVDGTKLYSISGTVLTEQSVGGGDCTPQTVDYLDTYFMVSDLNTQRFYISDNDNPTSWPALDYASKETHADNIKAVRVNFNDLFLFGEKTSEVWFNAGATSKDFPFNQSGNGVMQKGLGAVHSMAEMDNSIFWLADDWMVYRLNGYQPGVISTPTINQQIAAMTAKEQALAFAFVMTGNAFYVITFPEDHTTFVYNAATGLWHQWAEWIPASNTYTRHRANCHAEFNGAQVVGDYENGCIYALDMDAYTDNGAVIRRERTAPILTGDRTHFFMHRMEIEFKAGTGLKETQHGDTPQAMMQYSDDGGRTYSSELWQGIGKTGAYQDRAIWRRLGRSLTRKIRVAVSDPVEVCIVGAYIDMGKGAH